MRVCIKVLPLIVPVFALGVIWFPSKGLVLIHSFRGLRTESQALSSKLSTKKKKACF